VKRPHLTLDDLADDSAVLGAVDQLCTADRTYWRLTRRICKLQLRHQELVTEDAFAAQLDVEQLINERVNLMLALTARWAFNEGRRNRRRS
jgi:hypothetical protein